MADKQDNRAKRYGEERGTEPHNGTGNINPRNNKVDVSTPGNSAPTVENAGYAGIGDAAVNDRKLTGYTSNHSADA